MSVPPEDLPVTHHHDVYPAIDPIAHFQNQTYKGKVVLITGSSRGIGQEVALFYARAGATVVLVARQQSTLDAVRDVIVKEVPTATLASFVADVTKTTQVQAAVEGAVKKFGKLDIVLANAGTINEMKKPFTENDPDEWWNTIEVNVRGVYNVAHYALPHLDKTSGYFLITSSVAAQFRFPNSSAYQLSKHAVGRLNEFIKLEHPKVKTIAVHPGGIMTKLADLVPEIHQLLVDTLQLPAATILQLTSGKYDWFSGRFVSSNWDLGEVESQFKEKILAEDALVSRLAIPQA
ncbi:short-chain dehydrogenase/reductase SDR [Sistotremastrum suecicum HHB10207 ss-3]|uniref:Short-chain dehydrogenase/reductase SDR n=1 Tax=Sistotremastrum suecicum HHB10207 ss-3 TaxID=1314776 RepID=A0A166DIS9_9AGAM|nr:short-chain dehydrogenase/reductase SDR [Sistotremastrum suecicum HHB10207 ss-3]